MKEFKLCVLESPFAGDEKGNIKYARKCMKDMLMKGEAPYASHLLYTQPDVLDDNIKEDRDLGIYAGFAWKHQNNVHTVFYLDRGMSTGMKLAKDYCVEHNMSFEERYLFTEEDTSWKTSLVVYRTGNEKQRRNEWGHYHPVYLNLTKRGLDDIQGMRFDTIIACSCITDEDKETLTKYLSEDGVFI